MCSDSFIANCLLILTAKKNFQHWLIFGEVMRRTKNGAIFLAHPVHSCAVDRWLHYQDIMVLRMGPICVLSRYIFWSVHVCQYNET